ncbi:MAG TPA: ABC transporter permease, partial [Chthoniobacterales bacterium]
KAPGFTIAAVLILGFGIGANTAIFSLIDAVILKPLPFPEPDRLVQICEPYQNQQFTGLDYPDYVDIAAAQHTFSAVGVVMGGMFDLKVNGEPQHLQLDFISPSMFKVSGLPPLLGRVFTEQEDVPNGPFVVTLSEQCWRSRFHSDPNIIGKNIVLSENSFQVIGVVPGQANDWGPPPAEVYAPIHLLVPLGMVSTNRGYPLELRDVHYYVCIGRLKPGVNLAQAEADLETIHNNLLVRYPDTNRGYGLRAIPLLESMLTDYAATTWLLGAAVLCLLLISCANVANLLFARGLQRRREMSIRSALGATRWRLIAQLLTETLILSFLGGTLGLGIALASAETIKRLSPPGLYRFQELSLNLNALLFVFAVILLTSLLAGLIPAWNLSRASSAPALKDEGGRAVTSGLQRQRTQSILVTAQVALACVLLIAAGLLVRSFEAAQNIPLGFNPHHVLTVGVALNSVKYETDGVQTRAFWDALMSKVRRLPGVTAAAANNFLPFKWDWEYLSPFTVDGTPDPGPGKKPVLTWQMISNDYFRTLQIPVLQGRDFDSQDTVDKPSVTIVDSALAERYFPGQNPIGKGISAWTEEGVRDCTIVGVVPHLRFKSPGQTENALQAYFPYSQWNFDSIYLVVRSDLDPGVLIPAIRQTLSSIDSGVPIFDANTYETVIAEKFVTRRLCALLVTLFSVAALSLSAIGIYGVMAYSVGQRTRELAIRIALGAQVSNILRSVADQGIKIVCIGLLVGLGVALATARLIEGLLYGVSAIDFVTLLISTMILLIAAALACLLPALRAVRINPTRALRE